jgi:hypothetical protein
VGGLRCRGPQFIVTPGAVFEAEGFGINAEAENLDDQLGW